MHTFWKAFLYSFLIVSILGLILNGIILIIEKITGRHIKIF